MNQIWLLCNVLTIDESKSKQYTFDKIHTLDKI